MNGSVGGEPPGEGRACGALNHSPGARRPPATLTRPATEAPPGARNSASLGLPSRSGGLGTGARRGRPSAAGEPEVRSRLEAPARLLFVCAGSSAVSGPRPASAGGPRCALLACFRISGPRFSRPPARRRLPGPAGPPNPVLLGPRGGPVPGTPKLRLRCGGGAGCRSSDPRLLSSDPRLLSSASTRRAAPRPQRGLFAPQAALPRRCGPRRHADHPPPPRQASAPQAEHSPTSRTRDRLQSHHSPARAHCPCSPTPTSPRHPADTLGPPQSQPHTRTISCRHGPHRRSPTTPYKQLHTNNPTQAPHHSVPPRLSTFTSSRQTPKPRDIRTEGGSENTQPHGYTHGLKRASRSSPTGS